MVTINNSTFEEYTLMLIFTIMVIDFTSKIIPFSTIDISILDGTTSGCNNSQIKHIE